MLYCISSTLLVLLSASCGRVSVNAQMDRSSIQLLRKNTAGRLLQQSVVVGKVDQLILYNAITDLPLLTLTDGLMVNIDTLNVTTFTVVATTTGGAVGSVKFGYNGKNNVRSEILAPYSLCGDTGQDFKVCSFLVVGQHNITVTTYEGTKVNGTIGSIEKLSFRIVNSPPTISPTLVPTRLPTGEPIHTPTNAPTSVPTKTPVTNTPTGTPLLQMPPTSPVATKQPSVAPTRTPTNAPIVESSCNIPKVRIVGIQSQLEDKREMLVHYVSAVM